LRNLLLDQYTATDIDLFVGKVLSDLSNPEPPLRLAGVRELLRLDKSFYSSADDSAIRELAHRLRVGGLQVLTRPTILKDVIGKLGLKALLLPDRRRILIDSEVPDLKQRWSEAHEIGHDLIPWHADTMLGDNKSTLTPSCHQQIEGEANYAAGQLLFLRHRFTDDVRSLFPSIESIKQLKDRYQNTMTATLWRYVEIHTGLVVGAISGHPHRPCSDFSPRNPLRYFIRSRAFASQFSGVTESDVFAGMQAYCEDRNGGVLGRGEVRLYDNAGSAHVFQFETYFNRYEALTLGSHVRPSATMVSSYCGHTG
jgi:Zn-dependent peptidase ImmA (M78 family)